jgi:short-subunit dehydrogenase
MENVLITGGSTGIGFELARIFSHNNYKVIIASSNKENLINAKNKLEEENKNTIEILEQDLTKINGSIELYEKIKTMGININVLINNAGYGLIGSSEQIPFEEDEKMLIINCLNLVGLCKLILPDMYKQGNGKILNVASTGAFQPGPYTSTYFASKAFVLNYSRAIRYEAKSKGVQVNILCPGATKTNFFKREGKTVPKNAMLPEDVAKYAYKCLMNNKEVFIPGIINRIMQMFPVKIKMAFVANMKK